MKRVWTGCGHSHRRAASVLHGASGSAVWHWTRWWGLPGVWGNAGPGRGHAGDTLLISDSSSSSSFSVIKLPLSYLLLSCIAHLSVVSSPLVCLHHSITFFFALYQKSRLMWQICFCNLRVFVFEPPLGVSRLQRFHNAVTKGTAMMH